MVQPRPLAWGLCAVSLLGLAAPASAAPKTPASAEPGAEPPVAAPPAASAVTALEVSVFHGTNHEGLSDAPARQVPELREGPFAQYRRYVLLSRTRLALAEKSRQKLVLPNRRLLEAALQERLPDGSSRLLASINRPGGKDFMPLLEVKARPGQSFIVAGQSYKGGVLVLVFKLPAR
jgi:hypothetical protein